MRLFRKIFLITLCVITCGFTFTACGSPKDTTQIPIAPPNFAALVQNQKIELTWGGNTQTVDYYEISKDNGTTYANIGNTHQYSFENLTNGQSYTFKIRAVNKKGTSPESTVTATPATEASAVRDVRFVLHDGKITFTWQAPAYNGGSAITKYQISALFEYAENGIDNMTWRDVGVGSLTYTYDNFVNGYNGYAIPIGQGNHFFIRAVNSIGVGESIQVIASAPNSYPDGSPYPPQDIWTIAGHNQITLNWIQPIFDGNSPILGYKVMCIPTSNLNIVQDAINPNELPWIDVASTARTYTFTGLEDGTEYSLYVLAWNTLGIYELTLPSMLKKATPCC